MPIGLAWIWGIRWYRRGHGKASSVGRVGREGHGSVGEAWVGSIAWHKVVQLVLPRDHCCRLGVGSYWL